MIKSGNNFGYILNVSIVWIKIVEGIFSPFCGLRSKKNYESRCTVQRHVSEKKKVTAVHHCKQNETNSSYNNSYINRAEHKYNI